MRQEQHRIRHIVFVAEQDGESEAILKARLANALRSSPTLIEAFLVSVQYDGAPNFNVALCLKMDRGLPDFELLKAVHHEFALLFNNTQSMDTLFLNPVQHEQIVQVARPFYRRSAPGVQ